VETSTPVRQPTCHNPSHRPQPPPLSPPGLVHEVWAGLGHEDDLLDGGINSGRFRSSGRMRQAGASRRRTMDGGGMGNNLLISVF
jgi:hypothetical protein